MYGLKVTGTLRFLDRLIIWPSVSDFWVCHYEFRGSSAHKLMKIITIT
jgi:hypothetical protein